MLRVLVRVLATTRVLRRCYSSQQHHSHQHNHHHNNHHQLHRPHGMESLSPPSASNRGRIFTVALTGGPCSGKSSSLEHMSRVLAKHDVAVVTAPEVPTILINGGCVFPGFDDADKLFEFEAGVLQLQHAVESSFKRIAAVSGRTTVLVLDRALLDVSAYVPADMWARLITSMGWTDEQLLRSYDLVLHLVTAADGAEVRGGAPTRPHQGYRRHLALTLAACRRSSTRARTTRHVASRPRRLARSIVAYSRPGSIIRVVP